MPDDLETARESRLTLCQICGSFAYGLQIKGLPFTHGKTHCVGREEIFVLVARLAEAERERVNGLAEWIINKIKSSPRLAYHAPTDGLSIVYEVYGWLHVLCARAEQIPQYETWLQEKERERDAAQAEVALRDGVLAMTVARLGGIVEGQPTHRGNFLQRIDQLRQTERERDAAQAEAAAMRDELQVAREFLRSCSAAHVCHEPEFVAASDDRCNACVMEERIQAALSGTFGKALLDRLAAHADLLRRAGEALGPFAKIGLIAQELGPPRDRGPISISGMTEWVVRAAALVKEIEEVKRRA